MMIQVYKFGGASVKNAEGFKNVCSIIKNYGAKQQLAVVVSAIGKTTNQLEEVVNAKFEKKDESMILLHAIKEKHEHLLEELGVNRQHEVFKEINDLFIEVEWVIEEDREMPYDYVYDQIVSVGELVSSRILAAWLKQDGIDAAWVDARSLIQTDETYRDGRIQWKITDQKIQETLLPVLQQNKVVVTQGFIGSTSENNTTTLGREGSDYTAAILSSALMAEAMTIWKDVPGVLTGDPNVFENVSKINRLSYIEAIEMTYYGAKVIHPKTIQPLKNKNIPLYVKSFIHPEGEGSVISGDVELEYPPIVVIEPNQALLHFSSKDLSFIAEHHLAHLFEVFEKYRIKVNMMRNTAISFSVCVTYDSRKIKALTDELDNEFKLVIDNDLDLITVRHYHDATLPQLLEGKIVILEERIRKTLQMVVKAAPSIKFKN